MDKNLKTLSKWEISKLYVNGQITKEQYDEVFCSFDSSIQIVPNEEVPEMIPLIDKGIDVDKVPF